MSANQIKVTLVRSVIGSNEKVRATVRGLGLRKTNSSRVLENSPNVPSIFVVLNVPFTVKSCVGELVLIPIRLLLTSI